MTETIIDSRLDPRIQARNLHWQGWRVSSIAKYLGLKPATVHSWARRENWDGGSPHQRVAASTEARLIQLVNLPKKTDGDYKEMDKLAKMLTTVQTALHQSSEPVAVISNKAMPDYRPHTQSTIDNPPRETREPKEKREKVPSNRKPSKLIVLDDDQAERLSEIFTEQSFEYQKAWYRSGLVNRFRNLLKSRQIGATFFMAREAFLRAVKTGNNQIFLSASRAQAFQFKQYIADFLAMVGIEFKGDVPELANGAKFYFLGTNSRTAQGRNGDLYVDEYFWIQDFKRLRELAEPMASQARFRTTFFSTPSDELHPAYGFWTGTEFNDGRPENEHIKLDVSHAALQAGRLDPDAQFRQIVTLDDAEAGGCNLFDKVYLRQRYAPSVYDQLFKCQFVKPGDSVFEYGWLRTAAVDSMDVWHDYKPWTSPTRPCGIHPVWVAYDPADDGDAAGLVVVMPPQRRGDPFRVVERQLLHGNDFESQAEVIRELLSRYNVTKIVIDASGLGAAVYQLVQKFYPAVIGHKFTQELKAAWVHKAQALFRAKRVQWDSGSMAMDLQAAFMTIRIQKTNSGKSLTYGSGRNAIASHGDLAWALMMLFAEEPLDGSLSSNSSIEVF